MTTRQAWDRYKWLTPYGLTVGTLVLVFGAGAWKRGVDTANAQAVAQADTARVRADSALKVLVPLNEKADVILYLICKDNPDSACRNVRQP